jgi:polyether ionophore transport system permease protein
VPAASHVAGGRTTRPSAAFPRASPVRLIARRAFADARVRTLSFAYLFAAAAFINPIAYRHTYTTLAERLAFAHSFAHNKAVVLFYGKAYDLLTVGGYSAWRTGGVLTVLASVFGVLAAVRALRTEEESGRAELVLATGASRRDAYTGSLTAIAGGAVLLWAASWIGSLLGGLPAGGAAYLALAIVSVIPVFVGVGAVASQIAPTRRIALELGGAAVALAFVLRVIADTSNGLAWLRWLTPLGWAEELRPFTGAQPLVLVLPLAAATVLLVLAGRVAGTRDVGTGLLSSNDTSRARLGLLSSPTALTLREDRGSLLTWLIGAGALALIIGVISNSVSSAGISKQLQQEFAKLGTGSVVTPKGYLGFSFTFFVLVLSLFTCSQVSAARHEESSGRLETLLALPVGRWEWLGGRLALATAAAIVISLACGLLAWAGAVSQGVSLSLPLMLEAGANCLPVALLFLGIAALAYALVPRASAGIAYGLVTVGYLWQLSASLLGAPKWVVDLTPFAHVGAAPARPFQPGSALIMLAIGAACVAGALIAFARRDLTGA